MKIKEYITHKKRDACLQCRNMPQKIFFASNAGINKMEPGPESTLIHKRIVGKRITPMKSIGKFGSIFL